MSVPRVFVVQEPLRRSVNGSPMPLFDLSPAQEFGELITCLDWSDTKPDFRIEDLCAKLRNELWDFCDDDFLLMTGNPTAMALAAIIASQCSHGRLKLLVWTRANGGGYYRVMEVDLNVVG